MRDVELDCDVGPNVLVTRPPSTALAKLSRPNTFGALPRERLFHLIEQHRAHPLIWVGGPPGAGKTTLVASYLESQRLPGIWYHVDSGDADPASFFHYLGLAAAQELPGEQQSLPLLATEYLPDVANFSRRFFRDLYARLPRPAVVVLDDCQQVSIDSAFHQFVLDSAMEIPNGINVIMVSRGEPPSCYTRLLANRGMTIFDWNDMRLTRDETRAIASSVSGDEGILDSLFRQSAGWAAGLTLMLERLRRSGTGGGHLDAETRNAAFSYFECEILDRASPEHRHILLSSALLPFMTGAMAEQISGSSNAGQLLRSLSQRQLFTDCRPGSPPTYQYHDLFRDYLLVRAEATYTPSELKQLANTAAGLLKDNGELEQALALYVRAGDWTAAANLILQQAPCLLAQGRGQTLCRWIESLPADQLAAMPWVAYWQGTSLMAMDRHEAQAALERAWNGFQRANDESGQMLTAAGLIELCQHDWRNFAPMDRWLDVLDRLLARNPHFPSPDAELRVYCGLLVAMVRAQPQHRLFAVCIQRLPVLLEGALDANQRLIATTLLLLTHCLRLDLERARELRGALDALLGRADAAPWARVFALSRMAHSYWLELAYPKAARILNEAFRVAEDHGLKGADPFLFLQRHLLAMAQRDLCAIESNIQEMRQVLDPARKLGAAMVSRALGDQALLQRNLGAAIEHGEMATSLADEVASAPMQSIKRLALAAALLQDGRYEQAAARLDQARNLMRDSVLEGALRDYDLVDACIALRQQNRGACHRLLRQTLTAASWSGTTSQTFILYPDLMAELCAEALRAQIAVEQVRKLIKQYRLRPPSLDEEAWAWPIKIYAFGPFTVLKDEAPIGFSRRTQKRPLELLQALIALGGNDVSVASLTDCLWPDVEGDAGYHSFESTLYRLRQLLGSADALTLVGGRLSINAQYCWVDVWAFERQLTAVRAGADDPDYALQRLSQLYRGHLLEQVSENSWALAAREALRERFLAYILSAAKSCEAQQRWQDAAVIYQRGIEFDNLAERLYRGLMICHRALGNHAEGLRAYRRCRELLSVVLGVQPTAETQAVYESLKQTSAPSTALTCA